MTADSGNPELGMSADDRLKAAWSQLTLVLSFFPRIDTKLSVILGLDLGMLAMLSTRLPKIQDLTVWQATLVVACVVPIAVSFRHLYRGAFPDTQGGSTSLVFFGKIAAMPESEFKAAYQSRSNEALANDLLEQVWRNAKILASKFASLQNAYKALLIAIVPWLMAIAILSVK